MEIYTLEELFSDKSDFVTQVTTGVNSIYGTTFSIESPDIFKYELEQIYSWYIHNYTAFGGTLQEVTSNFLSRLCYDIADTYLTVEKKILHFISVNSTTLFKKGGLESHTVITPDLTSSNFTKQANTPSVVSPSTEFVDDYTDYQSKSTTSHSGTDTHDTDLSRTGSQDDALKVIAQLPKSLSEDMIDAVKENFLIMGDYAC